MTTDFPTIAVRSYDDLITAIVAVKNHLQLSDETIENLAGLTRGHFDKIRSGTKKAGPMALDCILGALAIELVVRPNPEATQKMARRWEKRNEKQVRHREPRPALWFADVGEGAVTTE
jgi:hypothetical protein